MKRKWEWIAEACNQKGLKESAGIAKRIDEIMKGLYGDRHTPTWKNVMSDLNNTLNDIITVARESLYCTACYMSKSCDECKYASEAGYCNEPDSLYQRFLSIIYEEKWKRHIKRNRFHG